MGFEGGFVDLRTQRWLRSFAAVPVKGTVGRSLNLMLETRLAPTESWLSAHTRLVGGALAICGLLWRLHYASEFYLNPDEAMHYTLAAHDWHGWTGFYRNATRVVHPPLFIPVLQGMLLFGRSEWLLRLVPAVAGALFPWFVMVWMQPLAGNAAALCAQLFLTFSPTLIDLSAEARAYTLAFLFLSICLVFMERALDHGSRRNMAWHHVFLYLAILTEYCVAWLVAALSVYALLRLWRSQASGGLKVAWVVGQVGALSLYLFLYFTHISRIPRAGLSGMYSTWLQEGFLQPHQHFLVFAVKGTLKQFNYLLQIRWLAWVGAITFPFGLYKLWRDKSLFQAILLALPLCVACLGAIFYLFPYGATRHTAILGIPIAAALGSAVAMMTRDRILPVLMAALPLIVIWNALSTDSYLPIARNRRHLVSMHEAIAFVGRSVPAGSVVFTDFATDLMLGYYLGCPDYDYYGSEEPYRMRECRGLHIVVAPTFQFNGPSDLRDSLSRVQAKYHLERPVWVAAGGFGSHIDVANSISDSRPFGSAIAIFQDLDLPAEGNPRL
jgi:hypothetical protein